MGNEPQYEECLLEPAPVPPMEPFKIEPVKQEPEPVKEDEDPEIKMWRERGVDVSIKPPCEKEWSPFDIAMNKHFKYDV